MHYFCSFDNSCAIQYPKLATYARLKFLQISSLLVIRIPVKFHVAIAKACILMWYVHTLLLCYLRVSCIISQATHKRVSSLNWAVLYLIKMHLDGFIFFHKNLFIISIWVVVIPLGITKTQTDICKDREICSCLRSPLLWDILLWLN